jgi:hypothetical protein
VLSFIFAYEYLNLFHRFSSLISAARQADFS